MNPDSSAPLLQKLCELQQRQLDQITGLSKHLTEVAAETRKSNEGYQRSLAIYEQSVRTYQESGTRHTREATRRGIMIASMLLLIAVSIIVSRFL